MDVAVLIQNRHTTYRDTVLYRFFPPTFIWQCLAVECSSEKSEAPAALVVHQQGWAGHMVMQCIISVYCQHFVLFYMPNNICIYTVYLKQ